MTSSSGQESSSEKTAVAGDALERARAEFPILKTLTYLNICEKAILPGVSRAAVDLYLDRMQSGRVSRVEHGEYVERAKTKFARLINAGTDEVAFTRTVSDGINSIACAIDWHAGDNVVLTSPLEHGNNVYPWSHLRRLGVQLRTVPSRGGAIDAEAMINAMDERTRVVAAASITFAPGLRTDIARIGRAARERGVLLVVDGVQSAGVMALDARTDMFDCLATSTSKGLLGLYGSGFLYCRRTVADALEPVYLSRTGVDSSGGAYSEGGSEAYRLAPGARRFEVGSYSMAAAYAVDASLDLILGLGKDTIQRHVLALSAAFTSGLEERGLPVSASPDSAFRSHIVTVGKLEDGGHDFSNDARINRIAAHLKANDVVFTIRRGMLRFGFHFFNDTGDVNRVLDLIDACPA